MSSRGAILGGIVGGIAGYLSFGTSYAFAATLGRSALIGAQYGSVVGGLLDPPKQPGVSGPRLDDLSVQTSTYGAAIPRVYGSAPVLGNVFWLEGDKIREKKKKKKSGGKGGGGGGSTAPPYSYFATFAVGLCLGPIAGIRRLWLGPNLVYDGAATTTGGVIQSGKSKSSWKLYLGSDDQTPDPRMQADKGVASVSAHPGLAYLVFYDLPLDKYGNSLAGVQVKAEVVAAGSYSVATLATLTPGGDIPYFSAYGQAGTHHEFEYYGLTYGWTSFPNGASYTHSTSRSDLSAIASYPITISTSFDLQTLMGAYWDGQVRYAIAHDQYWGTCSLLKNGVWSADLRPAVETSVSWFYVGNISPFVFGGGCWFADGAVFVSNCWLQFPSTNHTDLCRWELSSSGHPPNDINDKSGVTPATARLEGFHQDFSMFVNPAGTVWVMNVDWTGSGAVKTLTRYSKMLVLEETIDASFVFGSGSNGKIQGIAVDGDHLYVAHGSTTHQIRRYSLSTGAVDRTLSLTVADYPVRIMPRGGLVYIQNGAQVLAVNFDLFTPGTATLASIVQAECLKSALLTAGDLDVTDLAADTVRGFRLAEPAPIRGGLEALQAVWPFDVRAHGYKLEFLRRGNASVASIPATDLDARPAGATPGPLLSVPREMDSQLPARSVLRYLDVDREYDTGEQYTARYNTDAVNISTLDTPVVLTATEAARAVEVLHYTWWRERGADVSFKLPPSYLHLEPADVVTVTDAAGTAHVLRLTAIHYTAAGVLECTARREDYTAYSSAAVADTGQSTGAGLAVEGPTIAVLMDIPALDETGDAPGFYLGMCGLEAGWPGGVLVNSQDAGQTWTELDAVTDDSVIGSVAVPIGAATIFDQVDAAGSLTVALYAGEIASVTELEMLAGANHFAYGAHGRWEIIAARTATLNGNGTYTLRDFIRGRLGTEQHAASHAANDLLVQLTTAETGFISRAASQIDQAGTFRAVTIGMDMEDVGDEAFTYTGENLMPRSPVYLNGHRDAGSNDWILSWVRRARIDTEWRDYVDVPLDEASQAWEVEVYSSGAYTTLKRTLTGLTSATATYTSAQQVTDFGANQATLYLKVYQLSAAVGRGHPLTTTITR